MLLEKGVYYDQHVLLTKLLALPCFILYSDTNLPVTLGISLTSYFCILIPYDEKDVTLVLLLEGLVGLNRTIQLQLFWH